MRAVEGEGEREGEQERERERREGTAGKREGSIHNTLLNGDPLKKVKKSKKESKKRRKKESKKKKHLDPTSQRHVKNLISQQSLWTTHVIHPQKFSFHRSILSGYCLHHMEGPINSTLLNGLPTSC